MELLLDDLPSEDSIPCDVTSAEHRNECEKFDDYKYTRRCVIRYHPDYDKKWIRNPNLRDRIISIKENFGDSVTEKLDFFEFEVIIPNRGMAKKVPLTYPQWGIENGKKRLST